MRSLCLVPLPSSQPPYWWFFSPTDAPRFWLHTHSTCTLIPQTSHGHASSESFAHLVPVAEPETLLLACWFSLRLSSKCLWTAKALQDWARKRILELQQPTPSTMGCVLRTCYSSQHWSSIIPVTPLSVFWDTYHSYPIVGG